MKKRLLTMLLALVAIMMPIGAWELKSVDIQLGESGVATLYYGAYDLVIPKGVSASIITGVKQNQDGTVTVKEEDVTEIIPADCAVILRGAPGTHGFDIYEGELYAPVPSDNLLRGTDDETTISEEGYLYFTLDSENGENSASLKDWIYGGNRVMNEPHKAYLALPVDDYPKLAAMLEALDNPHLQHTHGGCEICGQVTVVEAAWGTSADALTSYGTLDDAIAAAREEGSTVGYIQLKSDVTSEFGYSVYGGTFTLDLNGKTLTSEGFTLTFDGGAVTITDGSENKTGKVITTAEGCATVNVDNGSTVSIDGGWYESVNQPAVKIGELANVTINGGEFYINDFNIGLIDNSGTLTITGGTFHAENAYYAVTVENSSTCTNILGGSFSAAQEADIRYRGSELDLSNHDNPMWISILLDDEELTDDCTITLPEGYGFYDANDKAMTDFQDGLYYIGKEEGVGFTVTFHGNNGTEETTEETVESPTGKYTLPECDFNAPEGKMFKAWLVGEEEYQPEDEIVVTGDTEVIAVWTEYVPQIVIKMSDIGEDGWEGASITVKKDGEELDETVTIEDGTEATVTLVYDLDSRYTFYWNMGSNDGECEFKIIVSGKTKYTGLGSDFSDDIEFFFALGDPFVVSFNANDGSGSMEDIETYESSVTLPECTFTAPEGMMFDGWQVGDDEENLYQPGEEITVTADTEIKAVWTEFVPQIVINMSDCCGDSWNDASITVMEDGKELGTATVDFDTNTVTFTYDPTCEYTFYWTEGYFDNECSFEIIVNGEKVFEALLYEFEDGTVSDCEDLTTEEPFFTLEIAEVTEIESLTIADGELTEYSAKLSHVGTLTYTRTLPNLMWNALYVPFEIPVSALTKNYDVAYVNDVHSFDTDDDGEIDDLQMEIIKITFGTLKANYPYLIRAKNVDAKVMNLELTDATLCATKKNKVTCSSVFMQFDVTGTYNTMPQEGNEDILAISTDGSWKKLAEGTALKPFRLYLTLTALDGSPVKVEEEALTRMRIVIRGEEGDETGIDQITTSHDKQTTTYFDLSGRRVKTPVKGGLYIVNGKKVVY